MRKFFLRKQFFSCKRLLMALVCIACCALSAAAADTWSYPTQKPDGKFGGGDGTAASPYLITSAQQLADLAYLVNNVVDFSEGQHYKLTKDITLNDIEFTTSGKPEKDVESYQTFTPIGHYMTTNCKSFKGIFDGGGHTISGLIPKMNDYMGLFGACWNAIIKNLTIKDSYLESNGHECILVNMGTLAAYAYKTNFYNCHVENGHIDDFIYLNSAYVFNTDNILIGGLVGSGALSVPPAHLMAPSLWYMSRRTPI